MSASLSNISPQETLSSRRNHTIDFLRGLAILGVVCVHSSLTFPAGIKKLDEILRLGAYGVQLFFFVSALTMCLMWDFRKEESHNILKFYIRRFLRIAPLFWVAIVVYLLINGRTPSHWAPAGISNLDISLTALFLHGFWPDAINSVVPGGWSIAVEMTFYFVFPFLMLKTKKETSFLFLAGAVFAVNLLILSPAWKFALNSFYQTPRQDLIKDFLSLQFFSQCYVFLLGIHIYRKMWHSPHVRLKNEIIFFVAMAALLGLHSLFFRGARVLVPFLWISSCFGIVLLALRYHLTNKLVELFGKKSYSIYLSHFAVLLLMQKIFTSLHYTSEGSLLYFAAGFFGTLALSYPLASVLYYAVEQPIHQLTAKIIRSF